MSDSESDFEGFNPSDIGSDIDLDVSDLSISDVSDVSSVDIPDDILDDEWTNNFSNLQFDEFQQAHGPVLPDGFDVETASPLDYFWLLMKPDLFVDIARYTNRYAQWRLEQDGEVGAPWKDTTYEEIRAFIGINILMGVNSLPESDDYWSSDKALGNDLVQSTMTCNRYQQLNKYFHVADRATELPRNHPNYDRCCKVRPVLDHVTNTFRDSYVTSREVSVDEAMVKFSGRLSMKQYMPAKPIKRGIKVWMLCDANSAYLSRFEIYLGRRGNAPEHGLGHDVVSRLTEGIRGTYRHVYFDNFFCGVPLVTSLLGNGLYSCGTVRSNRKGFPPELKKPRTLQNRGDYSVLQKGGSHLTATVWMDRKPVHTLSTLSQPTCVLEARRRVGANQIQVQQPHSLFAYNKFMGGVDLHDQYRMKYDVGRNSKRWWRYLFWFFVNCALVNSYIIYKEVSQRQTKKKRYRHKEFRVELMKLLIGGYSNRKRGLSDPTNGPVAQENVGAHIHVRLPGKRRRCWYHTKVLNERTETVYGCTVCKVHLCKDGCHNRYHNL